MVCVQDYADHEGIQLDPDLIKKNHGSYIIDTNVVFTIGQILLYGPLYVDHFDIYDNLNGEDKENVRPMTQ